MPNWLSLQEALEQALSKVTPITKSETVSIFEAHKRVLSESIVAPIDVPPWDNSAMDGYAVYINENTPSTCEVIDTVYAGDNPSISISQGQCARIMTGAPLPPGANAVVMQENVNRNHDEITINKMPNVGENIRPKANDIAKGALLFSAGHKLNGADLTLLSSVGLATVNCIKRAKVAIVATGSELIEPGNLCPKEKIYESHRAGLIAKVTDLGCDYTDAGIIKDDPSLIQETFLTLSKTHDLVISSGGVSVGDADWVKPALSSLGDLHLWKVAIKPGKPFAFGQFGDCYFCGLPGNPVSAHVTFDQIARPIINKLTGAQTSLPLTLTAKLSHDIKRRSGRLEFARATFSQNEHGELTVALLKNQSSAVMTSVVQANCYALLPKESDIINAGENVQIQPFSLECIQPC